MASVSGQGTTVNLPNFVGELFQVTPKDAPFLSMIGGLNGGTTESATYFTWQTVDNAAAGQNTALEGADATFSERDRTEFDNVLQIHHEGVELSYTKQAATGELGGPTNASGAEALLGIQPVQDERALQIELKLQQVKRDVEFSFLQGVYQRPADPTTTARQTRGLQNAISTNAVAAGTTDLSKDHVDELLRTMADNGAPLRNLVALCGSYNRQRFSDIYGYAPESRTVGGVNIQNVITEFADFPPVYDRHMPASEVYFTELSICRPAFLPIPGKGVFFIEPLDKTGSADKWQLYGEIGLKYGPEQWHGKITGTTTS